MKKALTIRSWAARNALTDEFAASKLMDAIVKGSNGFDFTIRYNWNRDGDRVLSATAFFKEPRAPKMPKRLKIMLRHKEGLLAACPLKEGDQGSFKTRDILESHGNIDEKRLSGTITERGVSVFWPRDPVIVHVKTARGVFTVRARHFNKE